MNTAKQELGSFGEDLAAEYLQSLGNLIIQKNYHSRYGEADLIALNPLTKERIFVEVKTRKSSQYGTAEEAIRPQKIMRLIKTINTYILKGHRNIHWRLDAIAIQLNAVNELEKISHFQNLLAWI